MGKQNILIVGAGINGLVAANYLQRFGFNITVVDRAEKVGGACVSEIMSVEGNSQKYALGASVLGLMQDFVFEETGLSNCLETFVPTHPKLLHFPGDNVATKFHRDLKELDIELKNKWNERGNVEGFHNDELRVIDFLQDGYRNAIPPTIQAAKAVLGNELTDLWITGNAKALFDHYFTSERLKIYLAMTISERDRKSVV